jgi:hypothetical protein
LQKERLWFAKEGVLPESEMNNISNGAPGWFYCLFYFEIARERERERESCLYTVQTLQHIFIVP